MKLLAVSDEECAALWDHYVPGRLDGYDLIISCGDLRAEYLSFLVTMARVPVLYVHGNHDESYAAEPPEGCDCIDGCLVTYQGVRILGLGGCMRYRPGRYQYTDAQMAWRVQRLRPAIRRAGGVDIVVTHAPPRGLGDMDDPAHRGFEALRGLINEFHPELLLHGHVHAGYDGRRPRVVRHGPTQVVNVSERRTVETADRPFAEEERGRVIWKKRSGQGHLVRPDWLPETE